MNSVYRLAPQAAWEAAVASGQPYEGGQLDTDSGFIHLSTHAQAGETAAMCAFLASDEASFITGEAINVSGGEEMH